MAPRLCVNNHLADPRYDSRYMPVRHSLKDIFLKDIWPTYIWPTYIWPTYIWPTYIWPV